MNQPGTSTKQVDGEAINKVRNVHVAALNNGDVDAWVACFTSDGVQMPPHAPANIGSERIRAWSQAFLAPFRVQFALIVDEVQGAGDWAFERGTYEIDLTPKAGGGPIHDIGKYITVYERQQAGDWKIARDIWNSNNPPFNPK